MINIIFGQKEHKLFPEGLSLPPLAEGQAYQLVLLNGEIVTGQLSLKPDRSLLYLNQGSPQEKTFGTQEVLRITYGAQKIPKYFDDSLKYKEWLDSLEIVFTSNFRDIWSQLEPEEIVYQDLLVEEQDARMVLLFNKVVSKLGKQDQVGMVFMSDLDQKKIIEVLQKIVCGHFPYNRSKIYCSSSERISISGESTNRVFGRSYLIALSLINEQ